LSEEKKAEEKNSDSKSPDADSSSSTRKRADSVVPQEFNFDLNDWLRWALRAEHQRVPMLKGLLFVSCYQKSFHSSSSSSSFGLNFFFFSFNDVSHQHFAALHVGLHLLIVRGVL
jgi:hypothetical protein